MPAAAMWQILCSSLVYMKACYLLHMWRNQSGWPAHLADDLVDEDAGQALSILGVPHCDV